MSSREPAALIFELAPEQPGSIVPPAEDRPPLDQLLPAEHLRDDLPLPELAEVDVIRHFIRLSQRNYAVDLGFYPLGSCTMKYNPKVNDELAGLAGFRDLHPYADEAHVQGALQLMWELQEMLAAIVGLPAVSLQPAAGAQGELTGLLMIRRYHREQGQGDRDTVLIPDSAHGTNPASAAAAGYRVMTIPSNGRGNISLEECRRAIDGRVAAMMLTNPNTLGLFEEHVLEVSQLLHRAGALLYGDGANLNALLGRVNSGAMGFDVMHLNLHKTFATPHGGGGPGAGPLAVAPHLAPYLPCPVVGRRSGRDGEAGAATFFLDFDRPSSIGRVRSFYGNFAVLVRAYAYLRALGSEGLREVSADAVLNANYLLSRLRGSYALPIDRACMHEFVLSGERQRARGVRTLDLAKRIIDYGFYPPTIYFPLIVEEAMMIEPTETETKGTLDRFAEAMERIAHEADADPELVKGAPHSTAIGRLDEVKAARQPNLRWTPPGGPRRSIAAR